MRCETVIDELYSRSLASADFPIRLVACPLNRDRDRCTRVGNRSRPTTGYTSTRATPRRDSNPSPRPSPNPNRRRSPNRIPSIRPSPIQDDPNKRGLRKSRATREPRRRGRMWQ